MKVRRPSTGLIVGVVALIVATSGSAIAATEITGSQIQDGTIGVKDLSKKAVAKLNGRRGKAGPQGPAGPAGPAGAKGDTGPSDAFSFFHDAAIALPNTSTPLSAPLAAGSYVIVAKLLFDNDSNFTSRAACTLTAGADTDTALIGTSANTASDDAATATLTVVHTFASAGVVTLACNAGSGPPATMSAVKITAIRVGNLTNTAI